MAKAKTASDILQLTDAEIADGVTHQPNQLPVNNRLVENILRDAMAASPGIPPTRDLITLAAGRRLAAVPVPVEENLPDYVAAVILKCDHVAQARMGHLALAV